MSSKVIFKYVLPLSMGAAQGIQMPSDLKVIHVGEQNGSPCFWGITDTSVMETKMRYFQIVGTGNWFPDEGLTYIGTVQQKQPDMFTEYVWHLFEKEM